MHIYVYIADLHGEVAKIYWMAKQICLRTEHLILVLHIIYKYHYCYYKVNSDFEKTRPKSYLWPTENDQKRPKTTLFVKKIMGLRVIFLNIQIRFIVAILVCLDDV